MEDGVRSYVLIVRKYNVPTGNTNRFRGSSSWAAVKKVWMQESILWHSDGYALPTYTVYTWKYIYLDLMDCKTAEQVFERGKERDKEIVVRFKSVLSSSLSPCLYIVSIKSRHWYIVLN